MNEQETYLCGNYQEHDWKLISFGANDGLTYDYKCSQCRSIKVVRLP